jgi:hypothetical protein
MRIRDMASKFHAKRKQRASIFLKRYDIMYVNFLVTFYHYATQGLVLNPIRLYLDLDQYLCCLQQPYMI